MREIRTWGSVRGVPGNRYPYRDQSVIRWLWTFLTPGADRSERFHPAMLPQQNG